MVLFQECVFSEYVTLNDQEKEVSSKKKEGNSVATSYERGCLEETELSLQGHGALCSPA